VTPEPDQLAALRELRARRIELAISNLLRGGVIISLTTIMLGIVIIFAHHPEYATQPGDLHALTHPHQSQPSTVTGVLSRVGQLRGQGIVLLGLLLLLLTPVARVAVCILAFAVQGDRIFVALTSFVLIVLVIGFLLGHAAA
jgi:uncharacterized membrane protein